MSVIVARTGAVVSREERLARMTRRDVIDRLAVCGIKGGTRSCSDYETAKLVMFGSEFVLTPGLHERVTRWIVEYIGV